MCKRGHERTPENLYKSGACKACAHLKNLSRAVTYNRVPGFCKNGHPRTPENVNKGRQCKICKKVHQAVFMKGLLLKDPIYFKRYRETYTPKARTKRQRRLYHHLYYIALPDGVVAKSLGVPLGINSLEMIEIKRLTIQLGRILKNDNKIGNINHNHGCNP